MVAVKLPKKVLNLFPAWEYCCPSCSTYVESKPSFCPNCRTPFDENRWRVPPRFLKSQDAMSEYAHKVLAPKLTPEQRELLFRYFTELFNDGVESGDFSAWTGGGGTRVVDDTVAHHGTYSAKLSSAGYIYKTLASTYTTVYARMYLRFSALPASGTYAKIMVLSTQSSYSPCASVGYYNDGGTFKWIIHVNDVYQSGSFYAQTVATDTWYCVELKAVNSGASGEVRVYIDGTERITLTGASVNGPFGRFYFMDFPSGWNNIYGDCVVIADTYIGPETAGQTGTKTWATDALFKKLGIQKTLDMDVAFQKQDIPEAFGLDAAFQKSFVTQKQMDVLFKRFGVLEGFAVDARFGVLMTQTVSGLIDVLLKRLGAAESFGLDAYFGAAEAETYAKAFGLNVIFAYRVRLPELWLDENGKLVLNISRPYAWVGS